MPVSYTTKTGDQIDRICFHHYGQMAGAVEAVLAANPGRVDLTPAILAPGLALTLPDLSPTADPASAPLTLWS